MPVKRVIERTAKPVKVWTEDIEDEAVIQLRDTASLPFIHSHVAAMADVHYGLGATVGSVVATVGAIVPAAVGVDIGCGMIAVKLNLTAKDLPDNLAQMRAAIENSVPHGRTDNGGPNDRGAWGNVPDAISVEWKNLNEDRRYQRLIKNHAELFSRKNNPARQLGTLGGGNHFIEVCLDKEGKVWVMLHSGSRGIGSKIGSYFIGKAKQEMERYFILLPNKDLAYLPEGSSYFDGYVEAVSWAQDYARLSRNLMMRETLTAIGRVLGTEVGNPEQLQMAVNCHHNYVSKERHFGKECFVTRKGAVSAKQGELGIIPGSMGARSFIVRGLGNPDSFTSCSHGAGRRMSRAAAKAKYSEADVIEQTKGVECKKDASVIDELPAAYKDIDTVMANQTDLVEVVAEIKQVLCVKG